MFKLHLTGIETAISRCILPGIGCSNCTLLELKQRVVKGTGRQGRVQIAPYWN